jgi:hypothetical protein
LSSASLAGTTTIDFYETTRIVDRMRFGYTLIGLALLAGCSKAPKTAIETKEPPKQVEALTGRQAFQQMYIAARQWAPDCQPLKLNNVPLAEVKATKGKSGAWQCVFVSQSRGKIKNYSWSAIEAEGNLHQGVFAGQEESYSPSHQDQPFLLAAFRTDSDDAYTEAAAKAEEYLKKNPNKQVNFALEQTPRFPDLAWRIYWGESISTSEYTVFVDATTGKFLERIR